AADVLHGNITGVGARLADLWQKDCGRRDAFCGAWRIARRGFLHPPDQFHDHPSDHAFYRLHCYLAAAAYAPHLEPDVVHRRGLDRYRHALSHVQPAISGACRGGARIRPEHQHAAALAHRRIGGAAVCRRRERDLESAGASPDRSGEWAVRAGWVVDGAALLATAALYPATVGYAAAHPCRVGAR